MSVSSVRSRAELYAVLYVMSGGGSAGCWLMVGGCDGCDDVSALFQTAPHVTYAKRSVLLRQDAAISDVNLTLGSERGSERLRLLGSSPCPCGPHTPYLALLHNHIRTTSSHHLSLDRHSVSIKIICTAPFTGSIEAQIALRQRTRRVNPFNRAPVCSTHLPCFCWSPVLTMSDHISTVATAVIPLTSLVSFTIYLATHPDSPASRLFRRDRIALPTVKAEGLNGDVVERPRSDPFDIYDDHVLHDGDPIGADGFWRKTHWQKVALLVSLMPPIIANIALLVKDLHTGREDAISSILLLPSHIITLILAFWYLFHRHTPAHWSTTIHLASSIFVQFLVLAALALLPNEPLPRAPSSLLLTYFAQSSVFKFEVTLRSLLPILHIPPLIVIMCIRRGPPLRIPLSALYPPKITDAIPVDHPSADVTQPNLCEEVEATIPEWLLFGYATNVVKKGYVAETMDVWDLPVLTHEMRECKSTRLS